MKQFYQPMCSPSSIETVTGMNYHLEDYRIRSLAAFGLALTVSVVAIVASLISAL